MLDSDYHQDWGLIMRSRNILRRDSMTQRNKKVRSAIQFIVDCQRGSSTDWISLYEWVDLIADTLKVVCQWGSHCMVWNRQIGVMLSKHPAFSKYYYRKSQIQIPMYMIDIIG